MVVDLVSPSAGRPATGERADRLFHALSDVTRRDIVARSMQGEHSVSALARHYPMSVTAVQKHVDVLSRAGLISKERRGREQIVRPGIEAIHDARRVLDGLEAMWRRRIERMGDILAQDQEESFT